MKLVKKI